jgi:hypothetical protein
MTHDFLFTRQITGSDALLQPLKAFWPLAFMLLKFVVS